MTNIHKNLDLVLFNVGARMEDDHKDRYIGYFWLLLEPFISALIYYLVFKVLLHRGEDNYIQFLFIGIISWKWFSTCVENGSGSIYGNRALYKKIYLPKIVFPWIEVIYNTLKFFIILAAVLLVYIFVLHTPITINYIYLPTLIISQFVFILGISTLLSAVLPYFVDLKIIIGFALRLGFYPTGVLFNLNRIPEKYKWMVDYNPMAQAVHSFRDIVVYGNRPNTIGFLLLLGAGLVTYAIGYFMIKTLDKEYAKIT